MRDRVYAIAPAGPRWEVPGDSTTTFSWEYDGGREKLLTLYEKGKARQWNSRERLDWSADVDPDDPLGTPDAYVPIFGSPVWERLDARAQREVKRHVAAWQWSQFMHGEQGALICASKIVQTVPDVDSKFYAATQVMDEARHVETYTRFLYEKIGLAYPINRNLEVLLGDVISDRRWDMTYLGMQVLIEGLALAAFGVIRDVAENPLASSINAYVMQDESRHVAFGRLALRDYYREISDAERAEREEFCIEACWLMRERFLGEEVWDNLGLGAEECVGFVRDSELQTQFRSLLFTRIVPTLRDIGIFGERIRRTFGEMGVIGYADTDLDGLSASDERVAEQVDERRSAQVAETIAAGTT